MKDLNWLQALAVIMSVGYCGIMLCLFISELIEKIKNYFINSSNGTATVRDRFNAEGEGHVKVGQQERKGYNVKGYAINAGRVVWEKTRLLLQKVGLRKTVFSKIEYKKKKVYN